MVRDSLFDRLGVAFFIVAIILIMNGGFAFECWDGSTGALVWWSMDNADIPAGLDQTDLCDVSGSDNTVGTGAGVTTGVSGMFNEAYECGGGGDVLYNITATESQYTAIDSFSANIWINSSDTTAYDKIFTEQTTTSPQWQLSTGAVGTGKYGVFIYDGVDSVITDSTVDLSDNTWHMITLIYYGNTTGCVYVNASLESCDTDALLNGNLFDADTRLSVCSAWKLVGPAWSNSITARVDEASIYNYTLDAGGGDLTQLTNLFTYNNVSGTVCTVNFSPTVAAINESTTFTGTKSGACGAWGGNYYWNYTRWSDGVQYFTGATNPDSQTLNFTGDWSGNFTATIGGVNYTKVQNITVAQRPDANFTVETAVADRWPSVVIQFNDTSTDPNTPPNTPFTNWYWDFDDGNASAVQNATNSFIAPGEYEVGLIVTSSIGLNSTEYTANVTVNGFALDVFDENTLVAITNWTFTVSNSTYSTNFSDQNNTFTWTNFSDFPTGEISIFIEASGYVPRYFYGNFSLGNYINLDAYLLDAASGVYTQYYVRDKGTLAGIEHALITWRRFLGGSWVTVEQRYTDSIGAALSYLSPYHYYMLTVSHPNYVTYTSTSFLPTSGTIIIYLNSTTTDTNLVNRSDFLYVDIAPYTLVVTNGTNITLTVHDPDSNLLHYGLWINFSNGTNAWNSTVSGSASGGQIQFNTSSVTGLVNSPTDPFYAIARFNVGAGNETATRTYYLSGNYSNSSMMSGLTGATTSYGAQTLIVLGILILLFVVGTASKYGYGSSAVGYVVVGAFMYIGWFPTTAGMIEIPIIAIIGSIAALATRRPD